MRGPYQILLPLLGLFLVRVDLTDLFPMGMRVKVVKIYDGDTLLVTNGSFTSKVRLSKIDAPEKKQPYLSGSGDSGRHSSDCLRRTLSGQEHQLKIEKLDIYGRILGDLDDLSYSLISNGCATLYPHAVFNSQKEKFRFLRALKNAKAAKRGLWNKNGFMQPKVWRKVSKRFSRRQ